MPDLPSDMNEAGPRLRAIRLARGLTLAEVAREADVTKGFLSLLERGRCRVSVPTLLRICQAMEISIGSLFEYPAETIVRGGTPLQMGGVDINEYLLTPENEQLIQVMRTVLKPGGGSDGAYSLAATTIFAIVVRGRLALTVDSLPRPLNAGESTTFSAALLHEWSNQTDSETEVIWVIAPPLSREALPTSISPQQSYPLLTQRLLITPLAEQDAVAFVAYRQDPGVARWQGWEPTYSEADAAGLIATQPSSNVPQSGGWLQLAIRDIGNEGLLGDVAIHTLAEYADTYEIGVTLAPASQHRGIATEAVSRVLDFLFREVGAHRVTAVCDSRNTEVARLLGGIGMRRESSQVDCEWFKGEWITLDSWAILKSER